MLQAIATTTAPNHPAMDNMINVLSNTLFIYLLIYTYIIWNIDLESNQNAKNVYSQ